MTSATACNTNTRFDKQLLTQLLLCDRHQRLNVVREHANTGGYLHWFKSHTTHLSALLSLSQFMFGLDFRSPQRRATSSGSVSLNSPFVPSHVMQFALDESDSSSSKNCHSWICPEPTTNIIKHFCVHSDFVFLGCARLNSCHSTLSLLFTFSNKLHFMYHKDDGNIWKNLTLYGPCIIL